jgi:hypothetical protein
VIESHVQDWKIARSKDVKEKTGIQLCLDKVSQSKKTPVLKSYILYCKTLIEKMVEPESQIPDYNTRIQKSRHILKSLQMQAPTPPKDPFVNDGLDYWNRCNYGRSQDNLDTPDLGGGPSADTQKMIIPYRKYSSACLQQPSPYKTSATSKSVKYCNELKT